jgi:hypothetical protein
MARIPVHRQPAGMPVAWPAGVQDFQTQIMLARGVVAGLPKAQRLAHASDARRLAIDHRYHANQSGNAANTAGIIGVGFGGGLVATSIAVGLTAITPAVIAVGVAGFALLAIGGVAAHMLNSSKAKNERKAMLLDYFAEEVSR